MRMYEVCGVWSLAAFHFRGGKREEKWTFHACQHALYTQHYHSTTLLCTQQMQGIVGKMAQDIGCESIVVSFPACLADL